MQILAGEMERVHKGFLITYHAGTMSSRGGGTYRIMLDRHARIILDAPIPALDSDTFAKREKFQAPEVLGTAGILKEDVGGLEQVTNTPRRG